MVVVFRHDILPGPVCEFVFDDGHTNKLVWVRENYDKMTIGGRPNPMFHAPLDGTFAGREKAEKSVKLAYLSYWEDKSVEQERTDVK